MKKIKKVSKVELVTYSMKMTIPTGNFANIIPEILVKADSINEAHEYISTHMNKLWKEYYLILERKPEAVAKPVKTVNAPVPAEAQKAQVVVTPAETQKSPVASAAYDKATQAITSCLSLDALTLIEKQVKASVKLEPGDKIRLFKLCDVRKEQLNAK